ncbi:MAG TPA: hypothetical protein VF657_08365 [Actinoplanes sp.]|jgi:hypothetical protein
MTAPEPIPPPAPKAVDEFTISPRWKNVIAIVITTVWAGGVLADAALIHFELSPYVHALMLCLGASVFGSNFVKGIRG